MTRHRPCWRRNCRRSTGIGEVVVGGSSLPAVRVELIPQALYKYGIGLEDVRAALASANAHSPKGGIDVGDQRYQIYANDQANKAVDYQSLIVAYRNGAAVHLSDVGEVIDSVENLRNAGLANGKPAVLIILYRQPGANIISHRRSGEGADAATEGLDFARHRHRTWRSTVRPPFAPRCATSSGP